MNFVHLRLFMYSNYVDGNITVLVVDLNNKNTEIQPNWSKYDRIGDNITALK